MLANAASMCAQLTWASKDIHYASDYALPNQLTTDTLIHAWRGERVGAVALIHISTSFIVVIFFNKVIENFLIAQYSP